MKDYSISKLSYKEVPLSNFMLIEPRTVKDMVSDRIYSVDKKTSGMLNWIIGMSNDQFSNKVYSVDKETWKSLVTKMISRSDTKESIERYKAIILNDTLISIIESHLNVGLNKLVEEIESLSKRPDFRIKVKDDDFIIELLVIKEDKDTPSESSGLIIRIDLRWNFITIWDCYISHDKGSITKVIPSPKPNVDMFLSDDFTEVVSFEDVQPLSYIKPMVDSLQSDLQTKLSVSEIIGHYRWVGLLPKRNLPFIDLDRSSELDRSYLETLSEMLTINNLTYQESIRLYPLAQSISITPFTINDLIEMYTHFLMEDDRAKPSLVSLVDLVQLAISNGLHSKQLSISK